MAAIKRPYQHAARLEQYSQYHKAGTRAGQWPRAVGLSATFPLPQVVPGLDPKTPIYAASFVMQLVQRRMAEYSMWNPDRFHTMEMRQRFQLGPFE